jgi:hypothetical protein
VTDYETGYRNGESSLLADVSTLCEQLDIDVGDRHEFEAIRAEVERLKSVIERKCTPGPLTVREAYAIACNEVKACAREGDDPGDVRSNLMPVNHAARGADEAREQ